MKFNDTRLYPSFWKQKKLAFEDRAVYYNIRLSSPVNALSKTMLNKDEDLIDAESKTDYKAGNIGGKATNALFVGSRR